MEGEMKLKMCVFKSHFSKIKLTLIISSGKNMTESKKLGASYSGIEHGRIALKLSTVYLRI